MEVKEESEKAGLQLSIQKTKIMACSPITSWQIDEETMGTVTDYFLGPGCMNHKLESRLPGEISITSDMQMTPPLWQKVKRNYKAS